MSKNVLTGQALEDAHDHFFLAYVSLERRSRWGDVTKPIYLILSLAHPDVTKELRVTTEEMIELIIKSLDRSIARYTNCNMPRVADNFSRRKIEFERRIALFQLSHPIDVEGLRTILFDLLSIRLD